MTSNNPLLVATIAPPVMEARRWIAGKAFGADRPLINVSQAAPVDPPPDQMRQAMAEAVLRQDEVHLYGPDLGLPALRSELADSITRRYQGQVSAKNIAITSGCNQAFCAAIATLAAPGDEVILPVPWYFNHKMWLDMNGIATVPLACGDDLVPDAGDAAALITARTRAIVLVTPNNPTGVEYPPMVIAAFRDLARRHGIALIIDETYRDFHSRPGAPHDLFGDPDWDDTVIHLYSFSKSFRLTGHRVGAMATSPARLSEVEKFIDTVTICPAQLGQHAALWGLRNLGDWLEGERRKILARGDAMRSGFAPLAERGWRLRGCGAYFAYVQHPFDLPSDQLARALVDQCAVLALPGSMFTPEGDAAGASHLRIAFANSDETGIAEVLKRLATVRP